MILISRGGDLAKVTDNFPTEFYPCYHLHWVNVDPGDRIINTVKTLVRNYSRPGFDKIHIEYKNSECFTRIVPDMNQEDFKSTCALVLPCEVIFAF